MRNEIFSKFSQQNTQIQIDVQMKTFFASSISITWSSNEITLCCILSSINRPVASLTVSSRLGSAVQSSVKTLRDTIKLTSFVNTENSHRIEDNYWRLTHAWRKLRRTLVHHLNSLLMQGRQGGLTGQCPGSYHVSQKCLTRIGKEINSLCIAVCFSIWCKPKNDDLLISTKDSL